MVVVSVQQPTGSRSIYRAPDQGIAARADYPDAPVSVVLDGSTPGAELFAVLVAIGGDIPLHYHPVFELQYVLSGTGLALDADGGQTPIAPGGTVLSPAGAAGAHGFRNTGPLPLTLLCVYPSPGGATPGRSAFEPGEMVGPGPRTTYLPPEHVRPVSLGHLPGRAAHIMDEQDRGAELFAEVISISGAVPLHHHPVFAYHFVASGIGVTIDADGRETPIAPGGSVLSPAGPDGAHAYRNLGDMPLQMVCVFPSPDGSRPQRSPLEAGQ
jgi:mannose-6-phosphate isomerase-like protein (cupin superfamily)